MKKLVSLLSLSLFGIAPALIPSALSQEAGLARLSASVLDVTAPSTRVSGAPGSMQIVERSCRSTSMADARRRIVDTAVQEWAFFGFQVEDQRGTAPVPGQPQNNNRRRFGPLNPLEVARVADSVGGYWSATPDSDWILARQNDAWNSSAGLASRWRDPWSAAFISWVMCESGFGEQRQFQRAIAHHSYIDQAIEARDGRADDAVYVAYDPGEEAINPGDMLCSGMRPVYRSLEQRRAQLGVGARTHCDIVVEVNEPEGLILTIGGNVRSSVRLKVFPAGNTGETNMAPLPTARVIFAHLKLKADAIEPDALRYTPTLRSMACTMDAPTTFATAGLAMPAGSC